ncbi:MAG: hypothetical protein DI603_17390 [Roseateles depolymerans]|uniref:Ice-binding protein C-terminal domain-containing protein n=1 Tax=Roseateles depolymerans TaxID=76731 RepID=A0A2W5F9W8_9BURK|nr:MAG: hypothetical protein DI603_17390 [Roseateles depolymerans]
MNLKKFLTRVTAAAAMAAAAVGAQADTYQFTLTGDYNATWLLASSPTPDDYGDGQGFVIWDVEGFADASEGVADVYFWSGDIGGGLQVNDFYGGDFALVSTDGPQLYTGTEDAPTFTLGTFSLTEYQGSGTYTLTVTNVSAVPEPASVALLLGGLGLVGAAAARRRRSENEEALDNA